jgi:hypothetical protein
MLSLVSDEWMSRDLPVLHAIRELEAEAAPGERLRVPQLVERTGFGERDVLKLLLRLQQANYLDGEPVATLQGVHDFRTSGLTDRGRRAVGQWPSEDPWAALVDLLSRQIEQEQDEDKRSRLVKLREGVLSAGRTVGVSLFTTFLQQQAGLT